MLNYIWAFLIIVSLLTAVGYDVYDEVHDTYRNGRGFPVTLIVTESQSPRQVRGVARIPLQAFNAFYGTTSLAYDLEVSILCALNSTGEGTFVLSLPEQSPHPWCTMARFSSVKGSLTGTIAELSYVGEQQARAVLRFEPLHFVKMRSITQAAIDFVATAVEIALGLIGVMALWLGLMKIAESAGLLTVLTRILKPVTRRLFPDVPSEHPALAAIIMNTAANMLGLSNAATPIGLKAMEELNRLNTKPGTATNAMITFLAINTGGLILIPATAIAVRAAAGSANPGIIIGTSIIGALCATIAGVTASKILQRLPRYKFDTEGDKKDKRKE